MQQRISVFDMFKIGVGPSSSHTMGPWRAAQQFLSDIGPAKLASITRISVNLFGSLAKTGKGHGTDIAVQLGLSGEDPETIDVNTIEPKIDAIAMSRQLPLAGQRELPFDPDIDIQFHRDQQLSQHPNALRFNAQFNDGESVEQTFFSVGGGFVVREGTQPKPREVKLPFPIDTAGQLLQYCGDNACPISQIVFRNELSWRSETEIGNQLNELKEAMVKSIHRGCRTSGVLPGGLNVQRRASMTATRLLGARIPESRGDWIETLKKQPRDFCSVLDWVGCFALAVNEENASFGRVVTAPTNGAAGVIPAVMLYCDCFCDFEDDFYEKFLLTAGEIGCLFKKGATISAAMGGCQAEIGVSSAMAAAALTECLGGTPEQSTEAAEIAMEHHLGMTCDPVGGLVQIPCIERNAMGAVKAITASQLALQRDPSKARVSLDAVIRTMWETARDMNAKYKETSEGGLAVQIAVNVSEC